MRGTEEFDEFVLWGSRGYSQLMLHTLQTDRHSKARLRAVVDDLENGFIHPRLNVPVISGDERVRSYGAVPVLLGVGYTARAGIGTRLAEEDALLATVVSWQSRRIEPDLHLGAGCLVNPDIRIGNCVRAGVGVHLLARLVTHDITIGDYSQIAPEVTLLGHLEIGDRVNIAPGAIIGNGTRERPLRIGTGAIIGVGAVVSRDVEPGARMVGNPAMTVTDWKRLRALLAGAG